jgi:hypothetical protein
MPIADVISLNLLDMAPMREFISRWAFISPCVSIVVV